MRPSLCVPRKQICPDYSNTFGLVIKHINKIGFQMLLNGVWKRCLDRTQKKATVLDLQLSVHNSCVQPCCAGEDHRVTNGTVKIQPAQLYSRANSSRVVAIEHLFLLGEDGRWEVKGLVLPKI